MDVSPAMVAEARRRAAALGSRARFEVGAADALPFAEASFDLVRCERLLQHVRNPEACVTELTRVLRPGGVVALIDTDWRTLTFWPDGQDVTDAVREAWMASSANPGAGAQLPDLLALSGLTEVTVTAEPLLMRSRRAADEPPLTMMVGNAVRSGALDQSSAEGWLSAVRTAAARGGSLGIVTVVAASGRKR